MDMICGGDAQRLYICAVATCKSSSPLPAADPRIPGKHVLPTWWGGHT